MMMITKGWSIKRKEKPELCFCFGRQSRRTMYWKLIVNFHYFKIPVSCFTFTENTSSSLIPHIFQLTMNFTCWVKGESHIYYFMLWVLPVVWHWSYEKTNIHNSHFQYGFLTEFHPLFWWIFKFILSEN